MVDRTKRVERRRAGQQEQSKEGEALPRTHLWQSCTVNTPPRLQNFGKTSAGIMNVTAGEEKMITLQRRRGSERELEKKNDFDGLRPSRDNLVTFFWTGFQLIWIPPSSSNSDDSPSLLPSSFVGADVWRLRQQCRHWYLMIPLAGTNYYQWLRAETWLLPHTLSLGGGRFLIAQAK